VLGIIRENGEYLLAPDKNIRVQKEDALIFLANENNCTKPLLQPAETVHWPRRNSSPIKPFGHILILGWNPVVCDMLAEFEKYCDGNTVITILTKKRNIHLHAETYTHLNVQLKRIEEFDKKTIQSEIKEETHAVIVLADYNVTPDISDDKTIMLLLKLKIIFNEMNFECPVISELRVATNEVLAKETGVTDFIVGSNLMALMTTQISQTRSLNKIFMDLLDEEGTEIYMKPARDYVELNRMVDLFSVAANCAEQNEVFLGYKTYNEVGERSIVLNPAKMDTERQVVTQREFVSSDWFIVLGQVQEK
jgi:hypothetical protein